MDDWQLLHKECGYCFISKSAGGKPIKEKRSFGNKVYANLDTRIAQNVEENITYRELKTTKRCSLSEITEAVKWAKFLLCKNNYCY